MITLTHETPSVETYIEIRLAAGLSRKSEEAARLALPNSLFAVTVYDDDQPIGIGRVIGDGGCFFEITDMALRPEYHGRGIGRQIMSALVDWLNNTAPSTAYVSLMADHGTVEFYERFGFAKAELPASSGMFLRIP